MNNEDRYLFWMTKALNRTSILEEIYLYHKIDNVLIAFRMPDHEFIAQNKFFPLEESQLIEIKRRVVDFKRNRNDWSVIPIISTVEKSLLFKSISMLEIRNIDKVFNKFDANTLLMPGRSKDLSLLGLKSEDIWSIDTKVGEFMRNKIVEIERSIEINRQTVKLIW